MTPEQIDVIYEQALDETAVQKRESHQKFLARVRYRFANLCQAEILEEVRAKAIQIDEGGVNAPNTVRVVSVNLLDKEIAELRGHKNPIGFASGVTAPIWPIVDKARKVDSHQFIKRTCEEYAAWCKTYYQPEVLDGRGMRSIDGLWAWQERERRALAAPPPTLSHEEALDDPKCMNTSNELSNDIIFELIIKFHGEGDAGFDAPNFARAIIKAERERLSKQEAYVVSDIGAYLPSTGDYAPQGTLLYAAPIPPTLEPVAEYDGVEFSRYTIRWTNGELPIGTKLYANYVSTIQGVE